MDSEGLVSISLTAAWRAMFDIDRRAADIARRLPSSGWRYHEGFTGRECIVPGCHTAGSLGGVLNATSPSLVVPGAGCDAAALEGSDALFAIIKLK